MTTKRETHRIAIEAQRIVDEGGLAAARRMANLLLVKALDKENVCERTERFNYNGRRWLIAVQEEGG